jgi:hypothetical protein
MSSFFNDSSTLSKEDADSIDYFVLFSRWYPLQCKPGQSKSDYRGELEVRLCHLKRILGLTESCLLHHVHKNQDII